MVDPLHHAAHHPSVELLLHATSRHAKAVEEAVQLRQPRSAASVATLSLPLDAKRRWVGHINNALEGGPVALLRPEEFNAARHLFANATRQR